MHHLQSCWAPQQRQGVWLPPRNETCHFHSHYIGQHKSHGHTPPQRERRVISFYAPDGQPEILKNCIPNDDTWIELFQDSAQGHFQSPFSMRKHLIENAEKVHAVILYSPALICCIFFFFLQSFSLLFLVRHFPRE